MRNFQLLTLAGLILLPLLAQDAYACQCGGFNTPYSVFAGADAVFVGKVVGVMDLAGNELSEDQLPTLDAYRDYRELLYRFQIQDRLKGVEAPEVSVATSINMCQFGFGKDGTWLVYAYKNPNPKAPLAASIFCSRTTGVSDATGDLHFLRGMLKGEPEPRIYGSIRLSGRESSGNARGDSFPGGITIVATSGRRRFTTVTDIKGLYRFDKLPNGRYLVVPKLPKRYRLVEWLNDNEVTLTDGHPDDHLSNTAMFQETRGRTAFVDLYVAVRKESVPERK